MQISEPLHGRQYTFTVDTNDRRLRTSQDPQGDIDETVQRVKDLLCILEMATYDLSPTSFVVVAPTAPRRQDWADMQAMEKCLELDTLKVAVRVGMCTVGGKKEPEYHPDIMAIMEIFPDFRTLPIEDQLVILELYKLDQARPIP